MSDNPLADWLRERGAWSGDGEPDTTSPPSTLGSSPSGPGPEPAASDAADAQLGPLPDDWPDERRPGPDRPRRAMLLIGLAALPWLGFVAVALGAFGGAERRGDAAQGQAAPSPSDSAPAVPADPTPGEASTGSGAPEPPPQPRTEEGPPPADDEQRAAAAAVLAVRTELTGETSASGGPVRYVDLAVAESVTWVEDIAIVEVAALVLESDGEQWDEGHPARFAVPVHLSEPAAVAVASPWALPPPATAEEPSWDPVADPDLASAAASALEEGGYTRITDVSLARSTDVPGVLATDLVAVGPGAGEAAIHRVWLRDADPPSLLTIER